jgi:anthraniloyl-CoA monooxygenase
MTRKWLPSAGLPIHAAGAARRSACNWATAALLGSTQVGWESPQDEPVLGNWLPPLAASAVSGAVQPTRCRRLATHADMARLKGQVSAAQRAVEAGSSTGWNCTAPTATRCRVSSRRWTNQRSDDYGGSLENRCCHPLEVFSAIRAVWRPAGMSVRIWPTTGARRQHRRRCRADRLVVQGGRLRCHRRVVGPDDARPNRFMGACTRTFADRIRNEVASRQWPSAISEADQVNSIIAAGRADLCAIACPHLADPV